MFSSPFVSAHPPVVNDASLLLFVLAIFNVLLVVFCQWYGLCSCEFPVRTCIFTTQSEACFLCMSTHRQSVLPLFLSLNTHTHTLETHSEVVAVFLNLLLKQHVGASLDHKRETKLRTSSWSTTYTRRWSHSHSWFVTFVFGGEFCHE